MPWTLDPTSRRRVWTARTATPTSPALSEVSSISLDRCNVHSSLSTGSAPSTPTVEHPPPELAATPPQRANVQAPSPKKLDNKLGADLELPVDPEFAAEPEYESEPEPEPEAEAEQMYCSPESTARPPPSKRAKAKQMLHDALTHYVDEHYRLKHTIEDWDGVAVEGYVIGQVALVCAENQWTAADLSELEAEE